MDTPTDGIQAKILQYEHWLNEVLKRDLQKAYEARRKLQLQLKEYEDLERNVELLQQSPPGQPYKTLVNLGQEIFCQARVDDTRHIYLNIGLGFHLQCALDEVPPAVAPRKALLARKVQAHTASISKLKATVKFVTEAIGELTILAADT